MVGASGVGRKNLMWCNFWDFSLWLKKESILEQMESTVRAEFCKWKDWDTWHQVFCIAVFIFQGWLSLSSVFVEMLVHHDEEKKASINYYIIIQDLVIGGGCNCRHSHPLWSHNCNQNTRCAKGHDQTKGFYSLCDHFAALSMHGKTGILSNIVWRLAAFPNL